MNHVIQILQGESFKFEKQDIKTLKEILSEKIPINLYQIDEIQNICKISEPYVGIIAIPSKIIKIYPKYQDIKLKQIQMMYFFINTKTHEFEESNEILNITEGTINEKIAQKFLRELSLIIQKGLPQLHISKIENSQFVKGHLNMIKTQENILFKKNTPFYCEYDEVSMKNPVSKILGAALYKIESIVPNDFIRYAHYLPYCTVDEGKRLSDEFEKIGREYPYSRALRWARLILYDLQVFSLGSGRFGSSFLIDFYWLFQVFVSKILKVYGKNYGLGIGSIVETPYIYYEKEYSYAYEPKKLEPDILYNYNKYSGTADVVLDTKCKSQIFLSSDIYQIEFYSSCLLAKKGILIYPKLNRENDFNVFQIKEELKKVYLKKIYSVYIDLTFNNTNEFIEKVNYFTKIISEIILI